MIHAPWLEKLRQKSETQKKLIAFSVSIVTTFIVVVLWLMARSAMQGM